MSIYLKANVRWTLDVARGYTNRLVKKLGLQLLSSNETPVSLQCTYRYKTLDLHGTCHNWNEYGTDRGGTLEQHIQKERIGPCRDPFETFVIDYTGAVMPCCALRSDLPQGIKFAVGNLSEPGTTIFDIYAGQLSAWRRSLVTFGSKTSPCTLAPIVTYLKNSLLPLRRGWKNICSTLAGISTSVHATENSLTGLL